MTNRTTDKTIIISVLGFINEHSGYVSITRHLQTNFKLDSSGLNRILTTLTRNGLVTKNMNDKWSVAITDPKGLSILHNPALLNDDGNFISTKGAIQSFKEEHPNLFTLITFVLGTILGLFIQYGFNRVFDDKKEKNDSTKEAQIKQTVIDTNSVSRH